MQSITHFAMLCSVATLVAAFVQSHATAEVLEEREEFRHEIIEWERENVTRLSLQPGTTFELPWFAKQTLAAYTKDVAKSGEVVNVFANLAEGEGSVVLTIGKKGVTASINTDGGSYRLHTLADGKHELAQIDVDTMMPDRDDTDAPRGVPYKSFTESEKNNPDGIGSEPDNDWADDDRELEGKTRIEDYEIRRYGPKLSKTRIDLAIGVTPDVVEWYEDQGYANDLYTEIEHMVAKANSAFDDSNVYVRLRLIGARVASYAVVDPSSLTQDLINLQDQSTVGLQQLHAIRDQWGADLLALLVMNGNESSCSGNTGRACGRAVTTRRIGSATDNPGSDFWNTTYERYGVTIMHTPPAFNALTFAHEIGHTIGAHHDHDTFAIQNSVATADFFARGWVLLGPKKRTIMAYRTRCKNLGFNCSIIPYFSNPDLTYMGAPLGSWNPTGTTHPAHNAKAINRMAWTVSKFRPTIIP